MTHSKYQAWLLGSSLQLKSPAICKNYQIHTLVLVHIFRVLYASFKFIIDKIK
jgi:hypothetical protein